jgi:TonB family protein
MTPVDTTAQNPPELHLLPGEEPLSSRHLLAMGIGSMVIHIVLAIAFFSLPTVIPPPRRSILTSDLRRAVHIVYPKTFEPTQKDPNLTKVVRHELDVRSEVQMEKSQAPRYRKPQPAPGPVSRPVPAPTPPTLVEPPKIQVAQTQPPQLPPTIAPTPSPTGAIPQAPPPPATSKPKIAFENVAPPTPLKTNGIVDPRLLLQRAAMDRMKAETDPRPPGGGGVTVGDVGDDQSNLSGLNMTPSKGKVGSNLQLLSDANGFDFKPYLIKVLASVRHNWMMVIPESAHMGRRGQVLIQFIIDKKGSVPKLVIATSSGTEAYDRAAVSGISASAPFPPLPPDFKGDQIRLQLSFSYNAPAR